MNYQNYAKYDDRPPYYKDKYSAQYDRGQGIEQLNESNMTIQDVFRTPFLFFQEHRKNYANMSSTALKGIQSDSELSKLFFSDKNFNRIQKMIKKEVYSRSKGQFKLDADQEARDLLISMRATYLEHARNLPNQLVRQVKKLNKLVIDEIVPGMITAIKQEYGYLQEINRPLQPIMRPMNVNNAGRKTLPSITTIWET